MATSNRVTEKQLEAVVDRINRIMGTPLTPYTKTEQGIKPNANNYHIDHAYGGVQLCKMSSREGCTGIDFTSGGHVPKRELMNYMQAFISGIYEKQELSKEVTK